MAQGPDKRRVPVRSNCFRGRRFAGEIHEGSIPYTVSATPDAPYPVTLITEAPDESIGGEDFRLAHEAQFRTVLAVADLLDAESEN